MEFSLQAALSLSRLKPELHAWFGGQRLPILGASSAKKAFTSSHDRGGNQHIRCGVFFDVLEVRQGFEQVNAVVTQIGELFLEKLKKVTQPVTRCGNVEVDEIPFCAPGPRLR
ncbi:MAG: hypothetical protein DMG08_11520 [Acidobacteria bacterium]|nr:MAG: hypothetical protein DMG08_11520 [Acidobacteriota bacterium]